MGYLKKTLRIAIYATIFLVNCQFLPELQFAVEKIGGLEQYVINGNNCAKVSVFVSDNGTLVWGDPVRVDLKACLNQTLIAYPQESQEKIEAFIKEVYLKYE